MTASLIDARPLPHPPLGRQPGLLRKIFTDTQNALDEMASTYGPVAGLGAGPVKLAVVGDPVALHELFGLPTDSFR